MEKRKVKLHCVITPHDIEVEQISPKKAVHVGTYPIFLGVETALDMACKAYLIETKKDQTIQTEVADLKLKLSVDDQQLYIDYELEVPKGKEKLADEVLGKALALLLK